MLFNIAIHGITSVGTYLNENNPLLLNAAVQGVGIMGKAFSLPLPADSDEGFSKMNIVNKLFTILTNPRTQTKVGFYTFINLILITLILDFRKNRFLNFR